MIEIFQPLDSPIDGRTITQNCYCHGEAEQLNCGDLFYSKVPPEPGVFEAVLAGQPALFYFWKGDGIDRGLVVLKSDRVGMAEAQTKFIGKSQVI